jgi:serine/threonine protein kinase
MTDETIFATALEKPTPAERDAYVADACADPEQRKRIEGLLAAHDRASKFLERPPVGVSDSDFAPTHAFGDPGDGPTHTSDGGPPTEAEGEDDLSFLAPPQRTDSLGRIGHYEVLEVLGRGGFGIVFRAFDDVLQRVVAVKVLSPAMAATSPARKRFIREARSAAPIQHENVVRVHETGEQPLPYLVMEFVPGETLQGRLDRAGPLEAPDALRIGRQVAEGLAAAHEKGLIHRDIKPANILIERGPQERAKITDFGLARAADDASLTRSGVVAGTPMYMAPEQARGDSLDHRADLFSFGSVLYAMLTGHPPFRASSTVAVLKRVCDEDPRPIREVIPEVPEWFCRIVEKLHAKDPAGRFQTAREVADLLADCEKQLQAHKELRDTSRIPAAKPAKRRMHPAVLGAVVSLSVVVGLSVLASVAALLTTEGGTSRDVAPVAPAPGPAAVAPPARAPAPALAVAPFDAARAKEHQDAWAAYLGVKAEETNAIGMKLRLIPPGSFTMGYAKEQADKVLPEMATESEKKLIRGSPAKAVRIEEPFYLGTCEVTVGQFRKFVEAKKYRTTAERDGKGGQVFDEKEKKYVHKPELIWSYLWPGTNEDCPVMFVTVADAEAFCDWLTEVDGRRYALPRPDQWEYACRAGTTTLWWTGDSKEVLLRSERLEAGVALPVGSLKPNPFGLYDMHGNAAEWVSAAGQSARRGNMGGNPARLAHSAWHQDIPATVAYTGTGFRVAIIGDLKPKPPAAGPGKPEPPLAVIQPLRDAVSARARAVTVAKAQFEAARADMLAVLAAQADLCEAKIKLAEAEDNEPILILNLRELVKLREEERALIAVRVKAALAAASEIDKADVRLAEARARLAKVRPPDVAPPPREK